ATENTEIKASLLCALRASVVNLSYWRVALRFTRPTETAKPLARRLRRVALVIVKPAPGFPPEPARFDIFHQKRAGAVFAVGEPLIEHLHDREARIEPDEIGQFERPHRMVGAKLHRRIDRRDRSDALIKRVDRLVDHRQQNAV